MAADVSALPPDEPRRSDMAPDAKAPPPEHPRRTVPRWLLLCLVAAALVLVVVVIRQRQDEFDWAKFLATFARVKPLWIAASAVLALSTYLGRAFRWRVFIRPMHPNPNLWNLFSATAVGFTAIVLLGRPGEMVRPYLIAKKENLSVSSQVAVWLLERIYDLLMALLIFGLALARVRASRIEVGRHLEWVLATGGWAVGIVSAICLTVLILLRQFSEPMRQRLMDGLGFLPQSVLARAEGIVTAFTHGVQSTRSYGYVLQVLLWSLLEWVIIVACYCCVFWAFPDTMRFRVTDVLIFVGFVSFGSLVQIPGIGGGMQIVAVVILSELFQLPLETSTGMAVIIWAITFVVIVPLGVGLAFHDGIRWGRLRQLGRGLPGIVAQSDAK